MNGPAHKIEILAPLNQAVELTRNILFRPFDLEKWFIIGFAAFLSHLAGGGGGGSFNPWSFRNRDRWWNLHGTTTTIGDHIQPAHLWLAIGLGLIVFAVILAVVLVLLWIGCRGRFIFVDCIVRNRGAITEPWHEFRSVANNYFGFVVVVMVVFFLLALAAAVPFVTSVVLHHGNIQFGPLTFVALICWAALFVVLALAWALISQFMIVAMYRRRCSAMEAFRSTINLISSDPVPFILYVLILVLLAICVAMVTCVATCVTCCIVAIPYVGTVILLPIYVLLAGYQLLFLRQFGPDWDAWAAVPAAVAVASPPPAEPPTGFGPPTTPPSPETPPGHSPYQPPGSSPPAAPPL